MRAEIAQLPYDRPFLRVNRTVPDWLIVSRWGEHAEYLTMSSAAGIGGAPPCSCSDGTRRCAGSGLRPAEKRAVRWFCMRGADGCAPQGLHPRRTWFGVLGPELPTGQDEAVFLLNRRLPTGLRVAGLFTPAEGYIRLRQAEDGRLQLVAVARELGGTDDSPGPSSPSLPTAEHDSHAWMLTAEHRPWAGEYVDTRD
jgi:hypothetical protein